MDKDTPGTLEERLRAKWRAAPITGGGSLNGRMYITDDGMRLRNPDGPEAADEIASLRARVEVYRAALTEIAEARWPDTPEIYPEVKASRGIDRVQAFARQAIKGTP